MPSNVNGKGLVWKRSFSSLTSTQIDVHRDVNILESEMCPRNWWQSKIESLMLEEEQGSAEGDTIMRLHSFGLAHDRLRGDHSPNTPGECFPDFKWVKNDLQDSGKFLEVLCSRLIRASSQAVKRLRFADVVRRAFGFCSPEIEAFVAHYDNFSLEMNKLCSHNNRLLRRLLSLSQSLRNAKADPFLCAAIDEACYPLTDGRGAARMLETSMIQPLVQVLEASTSLKGILRQLSVLESRFQRYYTSDSDWNIPFDTDTEFFHDLEYENLEALAVRLTADDAKVLRQLNIRSMGGEGNPIKNRAKNRWNELCWAVHDCITAKVGVTEKIQDLAYMMDGQKNYYSLSAIIQGAKASGGLPDLVKRFYSLVNSDYNYKSSQDPFDWTAQLPTLLVMESSYRSHDAGPIDQIVFVTQFFSKHDHTSYLRKREMDYFSQTPRNSLDEEDQLFNSDEDPHFCFDFYKGFHKIHNTARKYLLTKLT